jgi:hypothetical protein
LHFKINITYSLYEIQRRESLIKPGGIFQGRLWLKKGCFVDDGGDDDGGDDNVDLVY